jgi:hypothetical protein
MALPGYAAAASLYTTSRSYHEARRGPAGGPGLTVVAQHDPCNRPGGGGGGGIPRCCPQNRECKCGGECVTRPDGSVSCVGGECLAPNQSCQ